MLDRKQKVKSKVIILLTDGENNAGQLEPIQAAELAATMGIKVYTIGVGTKGQAPVPVTDAFGRQSLQWMQVNIDEATLAEGCIDHRRQILPRDRHRFAGEDLRRDRPSWKKRKSKRSTLSTTANWRCSRTRPAGSRFRRCC